MNSEQTAEDNLKLLQKRKRKAIYALLGSRDIDRSHCFYL